MYEEAFRHVVKQSIEESKVRVQEVKSGVLQAAMHTSVQIVLMSPDISIKNNQKEEIWSGKHLHFHFLITIPFFYRKTQVRFAAKIYFDNVPATTLEFVSDCATSKKQNLEVVRRDIRPVKFVSERTTSKKQNLEVVRHDIHSAFASYAHQDLDKVIGRIQGMQKVRSDLDIFLDKDSLRSGEYWEPRLKEEIKNRDVLFLFWSVAAKKSKWVEREWRYALKEKGLDAIDPVPIEYPVPPLPKKLNRKHSTDRYLHLLSQ